MRDAKIMHLLPPLTTYGVRFTDGAPTTTHTAGSLAADGVEVVLDEFGAEMLWLEAR